MYDSLSDVQKLLADHVCDHSGEVPLYSIHRLAETTKVSVASISRFVREIGFETFKDFKARLGRESIAAVQNIYEAITPQDGDAEIIEKAFAGNIRSLEETLRIVHRDELVQAAEMVADCKRVVFFGIGGSGNLARDAALRFSQLDIQAEAYVDAYQMVIQSLRMKRGHVAFGISHSGRSEATVTAVRTASEAGAAPIGLSNYLRSPLHRVSRIFLCTSFPETRVKAAALSSRIAQMCLLDALYLLVARRRTPSAEATEMLNETTERLLRIRNR
jgi:DNA-binding MurR/RpiR family transcriptional regulator